MTLAARPSIRKHAGDPGPVIEPVRRRWKQESSGIPVYRVRTIADILESSCWQLRLQALLLLSFGLVAVLAIGGLDGVIAYRAAQRSHEIGVCVAIGARSAMRTVSSGAKISASRSWRSGLASVCLSG